MAKRPLDPLLIAPQRHFAVPGAKTTTIHTLEKPPVLGSGGFTVSPDLKWIAWAQVDQSDSDIMLVENFR